ncbi:MAG: bifunctional adenosylcobinamide kinase/adenosylcobinamide-phosphate guanylyltransferase [Gemmataceae bacterium]|nr:bifunctional adenosylcobinamide kinase/adenosylcobinamide-phosphate guanylyltransferase [Gemmataceae bacterium]
MARLTLIVGGVRSGKSRFAEQLACTHDPITYLATAVPSDVPAGPPHDPEMALRIERHRARRAALGPRWRTIEEPWAVPEAVRAHGETGCVLVECLTLWVTNLLLGVPGREGLDDEAILAEVESLARAGEEVPARVLVVSNEVGCGIVPVNALARRFADVLGEANQRVATLATEVYGCMAGIPWRWKPQ